MNKWISQTKPLKRILLAEHHKNPMTLKKLLHTQTTSKVLTVCNKCYSINRWTNRSIFSKCWKVRVYSSLLICHQTIVRVLILINYHQCINCPNKNWSSSNCTRITWWLSRISKPLKLSSQALINITWIVSINYGTKWLDQNELIFLSLKMKVTSKQTNSRCNNFSIQNKINPKFSKIIRSKITLIQTYLQIAQITLQLMNHKSVMSQEPIWE